ncbi:hypothetical protein [Pseudarthrobacter sp. N5]|uniref:hypothetical protein n=1 Tax=Pseudarthrobacter sp. N5 TaxID=3418416 RepID=UPI003CED178D
MSTTETVAAPSGLWPELPLNQELILADSRGRRIVGTLDGMTEDRSTIWVQLLGGLGRRLVHHQDGYWLENARS